MNTPIVSIVMPVYNRPEELRVMIDSVIANTYSDWELLCVDDGSDDETKGILEHYAASDNRIKNIVRDIEPKGAQTCRNLGFDKSKGEFVIFADSDDYFAPFCIKQRVEELQRRPELDFLVFPSAYFTDKAAMHSVQVRKIFGLKTTYDDFSLFLERILPFVVWNNIYRRASLKKYNLRWDDRLLSLQDSDLNIQAILAGMKYDYALKPQDYGWRLPMGRNTITTKIFSEKHQNSNVYFLDKLFATVQSKQGNKYDKYLCNCAIFFIESACVETVAVGYARKLIAVVAKYCKIRAAVLSFRLMLLRMLSKVVPLRRAAYFAFFDYYLSRKIRESRYTKLKFQQLQKIK